MQDNAKLVSIRAARSIITIGSEAIIAVKERDSWLIRQSSWKCHDTGIEAVFVENPHDLATAEGTEIKGGKPWRGIKRTNATKVG